jgi:CheY-like chemotaxis protein
MNQLLENVQILLVHQDNDTRKEYVSQFEQLGALVDTAEDGLSGCMSFFKKIPTIVLTEMDMPNMDGHTMSRMLKALDFNGPIIGITSHLNLVSGPGSLDHGPNKIFNSNDTNYVVNSVVNIFHKD